MVGWPQAPKRIVRSTFLVAVELFGGDLPDNVERVEQVRAQDAFSVGSGEALDVGILGGPAYLDEAQLDVPLRAPVGERLPR